MFIDNIFEANAEPIKPAVPVTKIFIYFSFIKYN